MTTPTIGPLGAGARYVVGLALLAAAVAGDASGIVGGLEPHDVVLGLGVFPAVTVAAGLLARRHGAAPLRLTGAAGTIANCAVIVVLFATPYTAGAAALFYGLALLVAAWRRQPHCEATILSNLILRRDDQIGCPTFTPIDVAEARRRSATEGVRQ